MAKGPVVVALLKGRVVAKSFHMDWFTKEGGSALDQAVDGSVVGINEGEDN